MNRIKGLFLLLVVIGPLHMAEQLIFGIDEFYAIQRVVGAYHSWFPPAYADHATVILITIMFTAVSLSRLTERTAYKEVGFSGCPPHFAPVRDTTAKAVQELDQLKGELDNLLQQAQSPVTSTSQHRETA